MVPKGDLFFFFFPTRFFHYYPLARATSMGLHHRAMKGSLEKFPI